MNEMSNAADAATGSEPTAWWSPDATTSEDSVEGSWRWRGGWQRWIFPSFWLIYLGQTVGGLGEHATGVWFFVGVAILIAFAVVYIRGLPFGPVRMRPWQTIGAMVVLTALESILAREDALVMCIFIAVLAMATGSRYGFVFVAALAAAAVGLPAAVPSWHTGADWDMAVTLPLVAFAMFGFFAVVRSARELAAARAEVVRLAAENERSRIARDLHDLLGHSLTTITVKAALAKRLAERDPVRAAVEIGEVEALSRSALVDVRAAVAGYRDVSLAGELATARHVLRSAGVDPHLPGAIDVVPAEYSELFGWTVREGVTNVVRHARAANCEITVGPNWLQIEDDGRGAIVGDAGTGLLGLGERVAACGGTVHSGPSSVGWTLRIEVPAVDR